MNDFSRLDFEGLWKDREKVTEVECGILKSMLRGKKGGRALEAGAGKGRLTSNLNGSFSEYFALDAVPAFLEEMKCGNGKGKVVRVNADLYRTPFRNNSFDTVIMVRVLNFLKHPDKALKEFHRLLRPGGTAILSYYHKGSFVLVVDKFKAMGNGNDRQPKIASRELRPVLCSPFEEYFYSRSHVSNLASEAGLTVESVRSCGLEDYSPFSRLPASLFIRASGMPNPLGMIPHSFVSLKKAAGDELPVDSVEEVMACPDCHSEIEFESICSGPMSACRNCGHRFEYRKGVIRV